MKRVGQVLCFLVVSSVCLSGPLLAQSEAVKPTQREVSKGYWKDKYKKCKGKSVKQSSIGVNVTNGCGNYMPGPAGPQGPQGVPGPQGPKGPTGPTGPEFSPCFADAKLQASWDPNNPLVITHDMVPFTTVGEKTDNIEFCCSGNCFNVFSGGRFRVNFFVKLLTDDTVTGLSLKINGQLLPLAGVNITQSVSTSFWSSTTAYVITGEAIASIPAGAQVCLVVNHIPSNGSSFIYKDEYIPTSEPAYISLIKIGN